MGPQIGIRAKARAADQLNQSPAASTSETRQEGELMSSPVQDQATALDASRLEKADIGCIPRPTGRKLLPCVATSLFASTCTSNAWHVHGIATLMSRSKRHHYNPTQIHMTTSVLVCPLLAGFDRCCKVSGTYLPRGS